MNRAAAGLQRRGFRRNTSVVIMMRNRPEFLEVQAGAGRLGAAAVSVSWRSTAAELVYLAQHCGAKAIVFEADLWHIVEQAKKSLPGIAASDFIAVGGDAPGCSRYEEDFLAERGATAESTRRVEDAAVVIYTSGTTGKPKGAVRKFPKDAMHASMQFIGETPMRRTTSTSSPVRSTTRRRLGSWRSPRSWAGRRCSWTSSSPRRSCS